jgi:hypothetical protein
VLLTAFDGWVFPSVQDRHSRPTIPPDSQFVTDTHGAVHIALFLAEATHVLPLRISEARSMKFAMQSDANGIKQTHRIAPRMSTFRRKADMR